MSTPFQIVHTEMADLPAILELFEHSVTYQETNGYPVWRNYDQDAIARDIREKKQYKATAANDIGIIFSVAYRDRIIWRERDQGDSIYLHRIVVNPAFKGQKLFGLVVDWAKDHIKQKGLQSVRMDTWANNPTIINYYKTFGFEIIENYTTPDSVELPVHNRNLPLTLLELSNFPSNFSNFPKV